MPHPLSGAVSCSLALILSLQIRAADLPASKPESVVARYGLEEAQEPARERAGWRKPKRILVGGYIPRLAETLRATAPGIDFVSMDGTGAAAQAVGVDAVIGLCTPEIIAAGKSIRWIQLISASADRCVATPGVRERNILVTNMQRVGGPVIAEHVIAMMLAFSRGIDLFVQAQPRREWYAGWRDAGLPGRMTTVNGKTVLVVGLGGIGSEVAKRANALGMRVIATRASGLAGPKFVSYVGRPGELSMLAAEADFVVNTAPLTPQTTGIFDASFFSIMKPTAFFINVARGPSVVTAALVDALNDGKIGGAGLDVTDPAPLPPEHPLWKARNLIITPSAAGDSDLGFDAAVEVVKENVRRYAAGDRMLSVIDVRVGY